VVFLLVIVKLFRWVLRLMRYERKSNENRCRRNSVSLAQNFRYKGSSPTNHFAVRKLDELAFYMVLYLNFRKTFFRFITITRLSDRQEDKRTDISLMIQTPCIDAASNK